MRTFVVPDVHGDVDRFLRLLDKAGVTPSDEVVQLGDLGDYRERTRQQDMRTWVTALAMPNLKVLMGNHEASIFAHRHMFNGYDTPLSPTTAAIAEKGLTFALARHGFLLTHAGLAPQWVGLPTTNIEDIARWLNFQCTQPWDVYVPVRDSISFARRGSDPVGGIIWHSNREPLSTIPQLFGHNRVSDITKIENSLCLDVAQRDNDNLAGVWLPEYRVVAVGEDADFLERSLGEQ
jgi:hypothetical protein